MITLEIKWKLVANNETKTLAVPKGVTTGELLDLLGFIGEKDQVLVIYNGHPVFLDHVLETDGKITIMPILSGG